MLLLSVAICTFTTILLLAGASSKWFYAAAFIGFAIFLTGGPVINFTFVRENHSFFLICSMFFVGLASYLAEDEENGNAEQRLPSSRRQKYIARFVIAMSLYFLIFNYDLLRVRWISLNEQSQAISIFIAYISVVYFFLLRQAHKKEEKLES